jgi:N utilization substance protein B
MRPRSQARRLALQYLYMVDVGGRELAEPPAVFLQVHSDREDVRAFAAELIAAVLQDQARLDGMIAQSLEHWDLQRVAPVERNVLRLGCAELLGRGVPTGVALDEAVELAKDFGSKDSGGFVNGVLDRIRQQNEGQGSG